MSDFTKGDVVVLKSDGPKMTVAEVGDYSGPGLGPEDGVKCVWFEGSKHFEKVFDSGVLKKYTSRAMGAVGTRR